MARYPTFEEYQQRGNFKEGIKRCTDLLKKNPDDVQLLTVKLQLTLATEDDSETILEQLSSIRPPIQDLQEIVTIEEAVVTSQNDVFPRPKTNGPVVAKLWDNVFKASTAVNYKLDLLSLRFSRAIIDNRLSDAQQALIQLKALQPKNRTVYMAHAAMTQLLATSSEDLQSRLSLSLARKAVTERFADDKLLDCRVAGQIFAIQNSRKDLESITDRSFKESKQVYEALRKTERSEVNGVENKPESKDPTSVLPDQSLLSEVHSLKRQFSDLIESAASPEVITAFAINSIRFFHTATESIADDRRRVKVDACFLSVSALVRLFEQTNELRYLLLAAYFAETLLLQNAHIHEARLILVYLYMRLGLGSLALRLFDSLNVKEIQYDTVGHALFFRLSLTHPFESVLSRKTTLDPLDGASHALKVYTRCEEKLAENEASVLSHGQTGMIFDLQELRDSLRSSFSRRVIHLEQRRLARLVNSHNYQGVDTSQLGPKVTGFWLECKDNRDFAATFDYGYNVEKALHGSNGVLPGKTWILYALAADAAWCLASGVRPPVNDPQRLIEELTTQATDLDSLRLDDDATTSHGMRDSEYLAGDLACQVLNMMLNLTTNPAELSKDIASVHRSIVRLNVDALVASKDALADRLVDVAAYLDALRILLKACMYVKKQTNECVDELDKLAGLGKTPYTALQNYAKEQVKKIKAADAEAPIKQDGSIFEAVELFGDDGIKTFAESVAASAIEGWEGLLKTNTI